MYKNTCNPERVEQISDEEYMSTHTQILYHIIFSTKNRESVIVPKNKERLLKYIWGIIKRILLDFFELS